MERNELIEKIQNLMNKTVENGCTPEESRAAASKVDELLVKYAIDMSEIKDQQAAPEYTEYFVHEKKWSRTYGLHPHVSTLAKIIGKLNFCEVIGNKFLAYVGAKADVEIAQQMFTSLINKIRSQASVAYKAQGFRKEQMFDDRHPTAWQESFVEGACDALYLAFASRVHVREQKSAGAQINALVLDKRANAQEYAKTKYPVWYGLEKPKHKYSVPERKGYIGNSQAYKTGYATGQTMASDPGLRSGRASTLIQG